MDQSFQSLSVYLLRFEEVELYQVAFEQAILDSHYDHNIRQKEGNIACGDAMLTSQVDIPR